MQEAPHGALLRRLQGAGDSPEAARALAWIRLQRIARWTQQARSLRVPVCATARSGTARAPRPGELSPAPCPAPGTRELHLAETLENKAAASRREGATLFQRAAQAAAGRVEADMFQAEIWLSRSRPADALAVLQKAVQRDPASLEAYGALIDVLAAQSQEDALLRARSAAARLLHTTVAWDLERVWDRIERGRIDVIAAQDGDDIVIDVVDNGIGLPKESRARLLEPYVTTREKGTGLGLAIVGRVLEDHGGRIELNDAASLRPGARGAWVRMRFAISGQAKHAETDETTTKAEAVTGN